MNKRNHTPVTLRRRELPSGKVSLYLDIYIDGDRRCEHLRLYLVPEKTREDKAANRETLRLAEDIAARRLADILEMKRTGKVVTRTAYGTLFEMMTGEKREGTRKMWRTVGNTISSWQGWRRNLTDITPADVRDLKAHLTAKRLSGNSTKNYFAIAAAVMSEAVRRGWVANNPFLTVEKPRGEQTERCCLTMEELKRMADTPLRFDTLKRAFMFSALTGLRKSDIVRLRWSDVSEDNTRIIFRQKKTGGQEYLDISPSAAEWLPKRGEGMVFADKMTHFDKSRILRRWARMAGVDKPLTFHTARHTFATMMLELDVDIYTVSKLLGHRSVATTQIYARVVDKKKREAVSRIPRF